MEFDSISYRYGNTVLDSFSDPFQAKRFLKLKDFASRRLWVRSTLRKLFDVENWVDIDGELDDCEQELQRRQEVESTPMNSLTTPEIPDQSETPTMTQEIVQSVERHTIGPREDGGGLFIEQGDGVVVGERFDVEEEFNGGFLGSGSSLQALMAG